MCVFAITLINLPDPYFFSLALWLTQPYWISFYIHILFSIKRQHVFLWKRKKKWKTEFDQRNFGILENHFFLSLSLQSWKKIKRRKLIGQRKQCLESKGIASFFFPWSKDKQTKSSSMDKELLRYCEWIRKKMWAEAVHFSNTRFFFSSFFILSIQHTHNKKPLFSFD